MKLSEAILLGSTELRAVPFTRDDENGGGCAIGMAEKAAGTDYADRTFPILAKREDAPCGCKKYKQRLFREDYECPILTVGSVIAHIFNEHIFGDKSWTLEQLVDWVASIEPSSEPEAIEGGDPVESERRAEAIKI